MPAESVAPEVPVPAPANISPLGLSTTIISIIFFCGSFGDCRSEVLTELKNPLDLILETDLSNKKHRKIKRKKIF